MTPLEQKARGQHADALLKDPLLLEGIKQVRYAAHRAFEASKGDPETLARASNLLNAVNDFHRFFVLAVKQGEAAAKTIDSELREGRFVRGIGRLVRDRDSQADDMPWSQSR
jgi:hypothetical protein